ncbi:hypothetical protein Kpol_1004p24 [Vanderwaltozyma polyspora DSM 70294]|uniref:Major facilitator superfamily (MFS) profile domain-containing protein n=1 Tax=Vanderwaltozyma polyspora (strain ATCC 22028 / DSM 70294 / BCRC 21397 / CBS 2163 / NBRC 10782 / NRRL Y-8283 / UCD 57-17) TaxID=436907 RepID=A7TJ81_VANPO|nr:uncharacterized protein Kpol_1004p24 [Vanderwaltozyma polyspora DSM 70294]EDO17650.1 hypothetical protein Kpol_1004p24 [Vanderwaltozyma polyspora DSM 70294]
MSSSFEKHLSKPVFRDIPLSAQEWKEQLFVNPRKEIQLLNKNNDSIDNDENHNYETTIELRNEGTDYSESNSSTKDKLDHQEHVLEKCDSDKGSNSRFKPNYWALITSGSGLFSDGYINASIGTVSLCLKRIYGDSYTNSNAIKNVSSIAFAGTVCGQLIFGHLADNYSRKFAMLLGTSMLILFSILCAGAWGVGTSNTVPGGLFAAITAYRFFLGIAIGSEYSSSSPAAAEAANSLPADKRNRWFIWFTNFMIDFGFVVAAFVPLVLVWIFGENNLSPVWRLTIGLGAIPPISLFFMRLKFKEAESFKKTKFASHPPYWLVFKFYWFRTLVIGLIWFVYDFSTYAFGTYSSLIIEAIIGKEPPLTQTLGWNVVFNVFYLPGAFLGALFADYFGVRLTLSVGLIVQAIIGFAMAGSLEHLKKNVAGFVVIYGVFITLGEFSAGDNIGCIASKANASPIRGQVYGISAAIGKVGAFIGTYIFPIIINNAGGADTTSGLQAPYYVSSSLCIFSAVLAFFLLPALDPQSVLDEDAKFVSYLQSQGYDVSSMGTHDTDDESTTDLEK